MFLAPCGPALWFELILEGFVVLRISFLTLALCSLWVVPGHIVADDGGQKQEADKDALTLEKLFPEKGLFGSTASRAEFSADGRYVAYLFRPHVERRHGSDLWVYDFQQGKAERLTSVSILASFQDDTRKVRDDRVEKAKKSPANKKAAQKKNDGDQNEQGKKSDQDDGLSDQQRRGDWVSDKDADDEKAPRYQGVSSFEWAPKASELLFVSQGDVYKLKIGDKEPVRLTRTQTGERSVRYLPDGTGFTYLADEALMRVSFDSHLVEQLDPPLPSGEEMTSYRISEDGTKIALVTRKGESRSESGRKVTIVNYRDRFAKTTEVTRHVADDEVIEQTVSIYLYDLSDIFHEQGELTRIFSRKLTGPRDVVGTPNWSLDSQRVVFAAFDQSNSELSVHEIAFAAAEKEAKKKPPAKAAARSPGAAGGRRFRVAWRAPRAAATLRTGNPAA